MKHVFDPNVLDIYTHAYMYQNSIMIQTYHFKGMKKT